MGFYRLRAGEPLGKDCQVEVTGFPDFLSDVVHFFVGGVGSCFFGNTMNDGLAYVGVGVDLGGCDVDHLQRVGNFLQVCYCFFCRGSQAGLERVGAIASSVG